MSKPEDIPQDVWDAATGAYIAYCDEQSRLTQAPTEDELLNVAARAIIAERERCAEMVETKFRGRLLHASEASAAIRKGTP